MARRMLSVLIVAAVAVCVGCTSVQKGAGIGGAAGGGVGVGVGHATSMGGWAGGMAGLGVGAAAGAIAAEYFYPNEEDATAKAQIEELSRQLADASARANGFQSELDKERAQRQALLESYDKASRDLDDLKNKFPPGVEAKKQADGSIKLTILSEVLFASGKAELTSQGKKILAETGATIQREYPDAALEVRGHTDNEPIRHSGYKSNWELSCDRALAVLHHMTDVESFSQEKMMVSGFADTQPVAENGSTEGRQKNRRAEIVIRPKDVQMAAR